MPQLSPRIRDTQNPPIPAVRSWAGRCCGAAGPLLDLTQAVPGYPPHPDLLAKLAEAAGGRAAATYGPIDGEPALREALAADIPPLRRAGADRWWRSPPAQPSPHQLF